MTLEEELEQMRGYFGKASDDLFKSELNLHLAVYILSHHLDPSGYARPEPPAAEVLTNRRAAWYKWLEDNKAL